MLQTFFLQVSIWPSSCMAGRHCPLLLCFFFFINQPLANLDSWNEQSLSRNFYWLWKICEHLDRPTCKSGFDPRAWLAGIVLFSPRWLSFVNWNPSCSTYPPWSRTHPPRRILISSGQMANVDDFIALPHSTLSTYYHLTQLCNSKPLIAPRCNIRLWHVILFTRSTTYQEPNKCSLNKDNWHICAQK